MPDGVSLAAVYAVGVALACLASDAPALARLGLALVWPLGPIAFVVTIAGLIAVAAIAFPAFGLVVAMCGAAAWFLAGG